MNQNTDATKPQETEVSSQTQLAILLSIRGGLTSGFTVQRCISQIAKVGPAGNWEAAASKYEVGSSLAQALLTSGAFSSEVQLLIGFMDDHQVNPVQQLDPAIDYLKAVL